MHSGRTEEQKGECERWVQVPCQRNWGHSSDSDFKKQVDRKLEMRWIRRTSISLLRTVEL